MWNHLVTHAEEIGWAAVFALLFAIVFDLASPDSRIRGMIRHLKNRWSEYSIARLEKRIDQLKLQRDRYTRFLESVRSQYLVAFQFVLATLIFMAMGLAISEMDPIFSIITRTRPLFFGPYRALSICVFIVAGAVAIQGVKIVSLDSPSKMIAFIGKLSAEIQGLESKLKEMDPDDDDENDDLEDSAPAAPR